MAASHAPKTRTAAQGVGSEAANDATRGNCHGSAVALALHSPWMRGDYGVVLLVADVNRPVAGWRKRLPEARRLVPHFVRRRACTNINPCSEHERIARALERVARRRRKDDYLSGWNEGFAAAMKQAAKIRSNR